MASMETSAPFSPPPSASRSIKTGIAESSLVLPSTASWPSTSRLVVAKAETRCSGPLSWARSWLRRELLPSMAMRWGRSGQALRTQAENTAENSAGLMRFNKQRQPAPARNAMRVGQIAAQKREIDLAPGGERLVVVAARHRAADREQQHFRQRVGDTPRLARILNRRKMGEKRLQPRLLFEHGKGKAHGGGSRITPPTQNHACSNPLILVNPSSWPWGARCAHHGASLPP